MRLVDMNDPKIHKLMKIFFVIELSIILSNFKVTNALFLAAFMNWFFLSKSLTSN